MFEYTDQRIALSIDRGSVLWCIRIWDMGSRRPSGPAWHIAHVLSDFGGCDAVSAFDAFMQAVTRTSSRIVSIGCVYEPTISEDEAALLDILALAQERRAFEAMLLLREIVTPNGAIEASENAHVFAAILARAGRFLEAPDTCTRRFAHLAIGESIRPTQDLFGVRG